MHRGLRIGDPTKKKCRHGRRSLKYFDESAFIDFYGAWPITHNNDQLYEAIAIANGIHQWLCFADPIISERRFGRRCLISSLTTCIDCFGHRPPTRNIDNQPFINARQGHPTSYLPLGAMLWLHKAFLPRSVWRRFIMMRLPSPYRETKPLSGFGG